MTTEPKTLKVADALAREAAYMHHSEPITESSTIAPAREGMSYGLAYFRGLATNHSISAPARFGLRASGGDWVWVRQLPEGTASGWQLPIIEMFRPPAELPASEALEFVIIDGTLSFENAYFEGYYCKEEPA